MIKILVICIGGSLGAYLRYLVTLKTAEKYITTFPLGTFIVNLVGCFFIGFFWHLSDHMNLSENLRLFIFVGLLGAFTTFSSFALEIERLFSNSYYNMGMLYIAGSNLLGVILVFAGLILSKNIFKF